MQKKTGETGWVIEMYRMGVEEYWDGSGIDRSSWRTSIADAVRFSRQRDADKVLAWLLGGIGRSVEHAFVTVPNDPSPSHRTRGRVEQ